MNTVEHVLRDADPLRHEPRQPEGERERLRQAVVAAASDVAVPSSARLRGPAALAIAIAAVVIGIAIAGATIWSRGGTTLQAAVRFEVRLAEDHPVAGLREARVAGSDRVVYLHEEIVVTNADIEGSRVIPGDQPSHFGVGLAFNAAGAEKMRLATENHLGRPIALLIDGDVVFAPVLRGQIGASAVISGDFTQAEAERIVNGIGLRNRL
jgi:hypothetical protein